MALNLLILGGTAEAFALAVCLAGDARFATTYSLAGRTQTPRKPPLPTRIGGFGGIEGLTVYLRDHAIDVLVDATHPFAEQITSNADIAAAAMRIPLIVLERPAWQPSARDRWMFVPGLAAAAAALPDEPERIFLAVGRQSLAPFASKPQHHYVIRVIDPPDIPAAMLDVVILTGRGPFDLVEEIHLLSDHRISRLVSKNSGGTAASAKLDAARALGLPVILVERPTNPGVAALTSVDGVMERLALHHASLAKRSE